ncbi:MAG: N,N-dimethylformamidase, partial [Alphaproteobacteria bacterium]|nr:N,N-dimethylformamidase [Alphaproteobacteria bacterium]
MHPLLAYVDRWSVKPGERIKVMVGSAGNAPFEARIARVICADPNPQGPGYREIAMAHPITGTHAGREQSVQTGSWARIPALDLATARAGLAIGLTLWPTTPDKGRQGLLAWDAGGVALRILIDESGGAAVELETGGRIMRAATGKRMLRRSWYDIAVTLDPAKGR